MGLTRAMLARPRARAFAGAYDAERTFGHIDATVARQLAALTDSSHGTASMKKRGIDPMRSGNPLQQTGEECLAHVE
jgi:hypothetical protein